MHDAKTLKALVAAKLEIEEENRRRIEEEEKARKLFLKKFGKWLAELKSQFITASIEKKPLLIIKNEDTAYWSMLRDAGLDEYITYWSSEEIISKDYLEFYESRYDERYVRQFKKEINKIRTDISTEDYVVDFTNVSKKDPFEILDTSIYREFKEQAIHNWWLSAPCLICVRDDILSIYAIVEKYALAGKTSISLDIEEIPIKIIQTGAPEIITTELRLKFNAKIIFSNKSAVIETLKFLGFESDWSENYKLKISW